MKFGLISVAVLAGIWAQAFGAVSSMPAQVSNAGSPSQRNEVPTAEGTPAGPRFEVASIRPHKPGTADWAVARFTADGFTASNAPLQGIVVHAYDLHDPKLMGGAVAIPGAPGWILSDHYDIQAKMSDADIAALKSLPPDQQFLRKREMLQALLSDRFGLKAHRELRQQSCYSLRVEPNGPKNMKAAADGEVRNAVWSDANHVQYHAMTIAGFNMLLSGLVQCSVVDNTGLSGEYDFSLAFARDALMAQNRDPSAPAESDGLPSLFTAVQEQLGLKLQKAQVSVEVLVIDELHQPTEN